MGSADDMRSRLRELGRANHDRPAPDLESRLVERLRAEGPGVIRRSRRRRALLRASSAVVPVALFAAWFAVSEPAETSSREPVAARAGGDPAAAPVAPAPAVPDAPVAECERRGRPTADFREAAGGRRVLDLGERGRIVLERGSEATFEADRPCALGLRLGAGRVNVHAANLFGGELRVRADSADVVVHGTMFAVERVEGGLAVDVEEGAVGVERDGRALAPIVRAGQRLQLRATQAPVVAALSDGARQQLRAAFTVELAVTPAEASAGAQPQVAKVRPAKLVARADELWRSGARDEARSRYREAGSGDGPTAEAAWLALARRELSSGDPSAARAALASYRARFPAGELAAEAAGIEFRTALAARDRTRAAKIARRLIEHYPDTPQGAAAARWREEQGPGR